METIIAIAVTVFAVWWMHSTLKGEKKRNAAFEAKEKKQTEMYQRIIDELDKNVPEVQ